MSESPLIKKLSVLIVIPARNEEKNIPQLISRIENTFSSTRPPRDFEIVLVNDNSDDKTGEIAEQLSKIYKNIQVIHRTENPGFGFSMVSCYVLDSVRFLRSLKNQLSKIIFLIDY